MSDESDIAEAEAEGTGTPDPDGAPNDPEPGDIPPVEVPTDPAVPVEPPAPETPEEKVAREATERKTARIAAADAVEAKAAAKRAELRKQREIDSFAADRARFEHERAEFQRAQHVHQSREQLFHKVRTGQAHPDEFLREFGTSYADFTRQMLEANTPEAIAKAAQAKADALQKRLDERDAAYARARQEAQMQQVISSFTTYVDDQGDTFPHAWRLPESLLTAGAVRISHEYQRTHGGQNPTFEYVAAELDEEAKSLHSEQERRAARARATKPSNGKSPLASTPNGTAIKPTTSTLNAAAAGTRISPKTPPKMTEEEEYEWGLEQLRKARRA